jgi:glucose/mannose-6-phosphate isomerase
VFAVSYSGNTEETLSAYEDAKSRGTQIVAITSGGELKKRAVQDGYKVVTVPSGLQPRAATGYLFIPQLLMLADTGLIPSVDREVGETLSILRKMREDLAPGTAAQRNLAKRLAKRLNGRIPVIHSAVGITEILGYRWKTQINENAQSLAFAHHYPELNHNEIVGFDVPEHLVSQLEVITLISSKNHPQIQKRMEITTREITSSSGCRTVDVYAQGDSDLAQLFSLLYIGDWVSSYLAISYGIDPTPVEKIQLLKSRLVE